MRLVALALLVAGAATLGASAATTAPPDHAALALNVLPPGEGMTPPDLTRQIDLYDGLTPKQGNVTASDLTRYYKRETLGLGGAKAVRTEHPEKGVTIYRDAYDVPHIYGQSRAATEFGAGWATAEDRGLDLQLLRGPARIAALDVPGYDAFSIALSARQFVPSAQTEAFLAAQVTARVEDEAGPPAASPTSTRTSAGSTRTSSSRAASSRRSRATTSSRSARSSAPCSAPAAATRPRARSSSPALQQRLGTAQGLSVWNDLREQADAETPVTIADRVPVRVRADATSAPATSPIDAGSFSRRATLPVQRQADVERAPRRRVALVDRASDLRRRPAGRLLLAGDPHGGGPARRRARRARRRVPGPRLLSPDRARARLRVERDLRELRRHRPVRRDALRRRHRALPLQGQCTRDGHVRRGHAEGRRRPTRSSSTTRPCTARSIGYATSNGTKVAHLARALDARTRAARRDPVPDAVDRRRPLAAAVLQDDGRLRADVQLVLRRLEAHRDVLERAGCRCARPASIRGSRRTATARTSGAACSRRAAHPHVDRPDERRDRQLEQQARGRLPARPTTTGRTAPCIASSSCDAGIAAKKTHTPASVVAAMNAAATKDLRWTLVPLLADGARERDAAPSARDAQMLSLLRAEWDGRGSTRTSTARSTSRARRSWTRGGRSSPSPCSSRCSAR